MPTHEGGCRPARAAGEIEPGKRRIAESDAVDCMDAADRAGDAGNARRRGLVDARFTSRFSPLHQILLAAGAIEG